MAAGTPWEGLAPGSKLESKTLQAGHRQEQSALQLQARELFRPLTYAHPAHRRPQPRIRKVAGQSCFLPPSLAPD